MNAQHSGEWCNWQHSRFWICYSGFDSLLPNKYDAALTAPGLPNKIYDAVVAASQLVTHCASGSVMSRSGSHRLAA